MHNPYVCLDTYYDMINMGKFNKRIYPAPYSRATARRNPMIRNDRSLERAKRNNEPDSRENTIRSKTPCETRRMIMVSYGISITGSGSVQVEVNGEIIPFPDKGIVHTGSESTVILKAIPGVGYDFHSWSYTLDEIGRIENSPVLTLKHPYGGSITLNFKENAETIEFKQFMNEDQRSEEPGRSGKAGSL